MSRRVNAEEFRLGTVRFWKSELFSSVFSGYIQKFLSIYLLLKKKLRLVFLKLVFFKVLFLKKNRIILLVNVYKAFRKISMKKKYKKKRFNSRYEANVKTFTSFYESVNTFKNKRLKKIPIRSKTLDLFIKRKSWKRAKVEHPFFKKKKERDFLNKTIFSLTRINLKYFKFKIEKSLFRLLLFPVSVKLKNIFNLKNNNNIKILNKKTPIWFNLINISKLVYSRARKSKLRWFLYLKDSVNLFNLAFFFNKSSLISDFIGDLIKYKRKDFFRELIKLKHLLPFFNQFYFEPFNSSLRIYVLGKIRGQKARRFRRFVLKNGVRFSTQDINTNLSYSLTQTWNVFGSFGVKVWIYKNIKHSK